MKNVKFKAKRFDNGEWVVGSLIKNTAGIEERAYIVDNFNSMSDYSVIGIDPYTVCQFTGLKDCNGEEIFEHDLIHFVGYEPTAEVIWSEDDYAFMTTSDMNLFLLSDVIDVGKIEVVGNKFDKNKQYGKTNNNQCV